MVKPGPLSRSNKAFTLIELLVVIAVFGILAVTAIPSYKSYVIRSQVASALSVTASIQEQIEQAHSYGTVYGTNTQTIIDSGASNKPQFLESLIIGTYGCIIITYDLSQLHLVASSGQELQLMYCPQNVVGTDSIIWTCGYSAATTVGYAFYLPSDCQQLITKDTTF